MFLTQKVNLFLRNRAARKHASTRITLHGIEKNIADPPTENQRRKISPVSPRDSSRPSARTNPLPTRTWRDAALGSRHTSPQAPESTRPTAIAIDLPVHFR